MCARQKKSVDLLVQGVGSQEDDLLQGTFYKDPRVTWLNAVRKANREGRFSATDCFVDPGARQ